jgi:hypothetical protein
MLRRWDRKAYDFGLLMGILEMILGSMDLESVIKGKAWGHAPTVVPKPSSHGPSTGMRISGINARFWLLEG